MLLKDLKIPVRYLKGIGPLRAKNLFKLGINTLYDLVTYYPRTYQDRTSLVPIHKLQLGKVQTFSGRIVGHKTGCFKRKGIRVDRAILSDGLGCIAMLFFNQHSIKSYLPLGLELVVTGRVRRFGRELQVTQFDYEPNREEPLDTQRIVPIYPLKEGLSFNTQRLLRRAVRSALDQYLPFIEDYLPEGFSLKYGLLDLNTAFRSIHFPQSLKDIQKARSRLVFDEFLILQLALGQIRSSRIKSQGIQFRCRARIMERFIQSLPFKLTTAQKRAIETIRSDMASPRPMNRLLHGEVGSGKTIVAICAALLAKECGYQTALMAPTEILAEQHLFNLKELLKSLDISIDILTANVKGDLRNRTLKRVAEGEVDIVIGTHALIQEGVKFGRLGLCIVDEQHRFGVLQRAVLFEKAKQGGICSDVLIMSATPIPRTLALTLYGDLDISLLDELPAGRGGIRTFCRSERELPRIYDFIKMQIREGYQAYIVYPLIETSKELDLKAAKEMVEKLQNGVFKDLRLGLLHGRMKTSEKEKVMMAFRKREIEILVSTTVIEVGIDVPAATLMLIEHAERFGLSSLHQLRGRIGRGGAKSYCILLTTPAIAKRVNSRGEEEELLDEELSKAVKRLKTMVETNDGFRIAEVDLELRGPGQFFGTRQHGIPELKIAHLIRDRQLLEKAREAATSILEEDSSLAGYPLLQGLVRDYLDAQGELAQVG